MKVKYMLSLILIIGALACLSACGAGDRADTARIYEDIYMKASEAGTLSELETKESILARFEEENFSAVDINNQLNMVNYEPVQEFCKSASAGEAAETTIYVINDDGGFTQYDLEADAGKMDVSQQVIIWSEDGPVLDYSNEYKAKAWSYTDDGYLFFEDEHPTGEFGPWAETAIRVEPMAEELRDLTRKYMDPIGYGYNNLFIEGWNQSDYGQINLYDIYEILSGNTEESCDVPASEFETTVQRYLDISIEDIRSRTAYDADNDSYSYSCRGYIDAAKSPDMPYPEVVGSEENGDGTIILTVQGVWPKYKTDCAFIHEVVVKPDQNGGFKYISNRVLENVAEWTWYTPRKEID